jgi:hypothetical protein
MKLLSGVQVSQHWDGQGTLRLGKITVLQASVARTKVNCTYLHRDVPKRIPTHHQCCGLYMNSRGWRSALPGLTDSITGEMNGYLRNVRMGYKHTFYCKN